LKKKTEPPKEAYKIIFLCG